MVTKCHVLKVMTGAACIMGSSLYARESWVSAMAKEMDRHEQEMRHYFDEMWSSFDRFNKDISDIYEPAIDIDLSEDKDALKVTISDINVDAIEAAKNKEGNVLTITDKQGMLSIELALEYKNFLAVHANLERVVEKEEKQKTTKDAAQAKEPKAKEAQRVVATQRSTASAAFGRWLAEKVDLGASTVEFVSKDKTLTIAIPKVKVTSEPVPVIVK